MDTARPGPPPTAALLDAVAHQRAACARLGSPFYAGLLDLVAADVAADGPAAAAMAGPWSDDLVRLAVVLRYLAALNRLVADGSAPDLAAHWPPARPLPDAATGAVLAATTASHLPRILAEMPGVVQTNEVGRSAVLAGGFLTVAAATGAPLRLLEVGASAGLNLCWDRYGYLDRGTAWGDPAAPLVFTGPYDGAASPLVGPVEVVERRGCDLRPVDVRSPAEVDRLRSFVWPDQTDRLARLDAAVAVARAEDLRLDAESAPTWLPAALAEPVDGTATVVFHSIALQYLSRSDRASVRATIAGAGARATSRAPLAWLAFEAADAERAELTLTTWPGGTGRVLARAGYHGSPVTWTAGAGHPGTAQ